MACVITDKTTKETESKNHPGSKITTTRITQKCSNYSDDLKEEEEDKEYEINKQEITMAEIAEHFRRFMGKKHSEHKYSDMLDFTEAFSEYVANIKDNVEE